MGSFAEKVGGRGRDRTGDPLLAKQVLSQLSYTPTVAAVLNFKAFATDRKLPGLAPFPPLHVWPPHFLDLRSCGQTFSCAAAFQFGF
jgi:hypothetical protein